VPTPPDSLPGHTKQVTIHSVIPDDEAPPWSATGSVPPRSIRPPSARTTDGVIEAGLEVTPSTARGS